MVLGATEGALWVMSLALYTSVLLARRGKGASLTLSSRMPCRCVLWTDPDRMVRAGVLDRGGALGRAFAPSFVTRSQSSRPDSQRCRSLIFVAYICALSPDPRHRLTSSLYRIAAGRG